MGSSDDRNPYLRKNGKPWLRRSVVAFLDILGFQHFLTTAIKERREHKSLLALQGALDNSIQELQPSNISHSERDLYAVRSFTDNILIGFPIQGFDSEGPLGLVLFNVALFQLKMVQSGFFVRGALTIGNLHMGQIVYGKGLLEAYRIEKELARDPRIVLGKSAHADFARHIGYYAKPKSSPQYGEWLLDADGQIFLNYLQIYFDATAYDIPHMLKVLEGHKSEVETKLEECKDHPTLWSKYAWVAQYHNFFCKSYKKRLFAQQQISARLLNLKPRSLF